jgi:hypothetical protein
VFSFPDWSTGQDDKDLERRKRSREAQRRYRESHREEIRTAARRYRESHREELNARARHKWQTTPELRDKRRVQNRLWQRENALKKVYGISLADYEAMFERQGGACAICKRTGVTLCVDHCHLTGQVRGLLCTQCNCAIGLCRDDPALLRAAAEYLQAARDRQKAQDSPCAVAGVSSGEGSGGSPKGTYATRESMAAVPIPKERNTR